MSVYSGLAYCKNTVAQKVKKKSMLQYSQKSCNYKKSRSMRDSFSLSITSLCWVQPEDFNPLHPFYTLCSYDHRIAATACLSDKLMEKLNKSAWNTPRPTLSSMINIKSISWVCKSSKSNGRAKSFSTTNECFKLLRKILHPKDLLWLVKLLIY